MSSSRRRGRTRRKRAGTGCIGVSQNAMDDEKRFGWKWTGRMNSQATVFVVVQIRIVFVVQCTCTFTVARIRHRWPFSCCPCWDVRYGAGWCNWTQLGPVPVHNKNYHFTHSQYENRNNDLHFIGSDFNSQC